MAPWEPLCRQQEPVNSWPGSQQNDLRVETLGGPKAAISSAFFSPERVRWWGFLVFLIKPGGSGVPTATSVTSWERRRAIGARPGGLGLTPAVPATASDMTPDGTVQPGGCDADVMAGPTAGPVDAAPTGKLDRYSSVVTLNAPGTGTANAAEHSHKIVTLLRIMSSESFPV